MSFFKKKFRNITLEKLIFLDFFGYFLYFFNNLFLKKEVYPSKFKILIWDKIFTPITIIIDFLIGYKFGKNIGNFYNSFMKKIFGNQRFSKSFYKNFTAHLIVIAEK